MATRVELSFEEGSNICKGYGCVEFKTKEEADKKDWMMARAIGKGFTTIKGRDVALEKNGQILNGNVVTLKIGEENAELPFQQGDVIVVQNFKVNDPLPQIRERLRARFVQCGQIKELFLPENLNLQNDKGTAYIEFAEYDGFKKAFHRQYADPLPGDSKRLSIITPKFEEMPFLSRMGGGRGGKWGYKDDNGYIEDDLPEDPTRSLLPIATELASTGSCYLACDTCISFFVPQNEADGGGFCSRLGVWDSEPFYPHNQHNRIPQIFSRKWKNYSALE
ncbi:hypothetical protein LguiA_025573 [Lonicera macranthoides]